MSSFDIVNIAGGDRVDLGAHLAGRWGPAQVLDLVAGGSHAFDATDAEICAFVIDGDGTVAMDDQVVALDTGAAITLVKGSAAKITAGSPMQLFAAWLPA